MNVKDIKNSYKRYARVYDILFGAILRPGRKQAVRALEIQPGGRVLEVGVGTGLSLGLYPADAKVTGIRNFMAKSETDGPWTPYHRIFERHFYAHTRESDSPSEDE